MDAQTSESNLLNEEIEKEYQIFLAKLDLLKAEQDKLFKEYRERLEQMKMEQLRQNINSTL